MPLIYFDSDNKLSKLFDVPTAFDIPFLAGSLGELSYLLAEGQEVLLPKAFDKESGFDSIKDLSWKERDFVFLAAPDRLAVSGWTVARHYASDSPGVLWEDEAGNYFGLVSKEELLAAQSRKTPETFQSDLVLVTLENYQQVSLEILQGINFSAPPKRVETLGSGAIVLSSQVENSTICGPCFISENSVVTNSTILPGTIIIDSIIQDSTLFQDTVYKSFVSGSRSEKSLISKAHLTGGVLKSAILPALSHLNLK